MSSNNHKKSVRFANNNGSPSATAAPDEDNEPQQQQRVKKRPRLEEEKKNKKKERPNEDELDDIDDWAPEDDDEQQDQLEGLPSESERRRAKRARRQRRSGNNVDDEDDDSDGSHTVTAFESTKIDDTTSLATEGIPIEPFHMNNEKNDGTGYFDGDTYIFRKRDADDEPDAWLDGLKDTDTALFIDSNDSKTAASIDDTDSSPDRNDNDVVEDRSKEEWYARILPLVSDTETIMQAISRYGSLLKREPLSWSNKKKRKNGAHPPNDESSSSTHHHSQAYQFAQNSLNDLTEAANALLRMGDVDIYQKTRNDLLEHVVVVVPPHAQNQNTVTQQNPDDDGGGGQQQIRWEYKGSQDGQIHGPFSAKEMKAWIQAGYFVGSQAVQVRSVREGKPKSTVQDLLSDLMDDDDEEEKEKDEQKIADKEDDANGHEWAQLVRGEWMSSEEVDFDASG